MRHRCVIAAPHAAGLLLRTSAPSSAAARRTLAKLLLRLAEIDITQLEMGESPDTLVISEIEGDAGPAQIVYRCGGTVHLKQLDKLCERVGWPGRPIDKVKGALANSYLVRTLDCTRLYRCCISSEAVWLLATSRTCVCARQFMHALTLPVRTQSWPGHIMAWWHTFASLAQLHIGLLADTRRGW